MKQLIKKVKQISMLLLVISFIGCENDDVLLPQVISGFTHTINADTGTVTFINTSVNSNNYFWTFGDGTSSTLKNPIKTYTAGEYTVTLKTTNVAGASDTSEDIIVISDVGAPVITLLGDTTINILVGGTFTDEGATATDDVDGDITANIVVGGDTVDVDTAATYTITYNVSDAAGNAATERTRTVIVAADVVAPVITLTGSATINIMVGDTFTDPGATATDDVDGDITANIVVGGDTVDANTAGTYIITYNVSDAAGNAATERTRTVIVAADIVKPVITLTGNATINIMVGDTYTDEGATATDDLDGDITANIEVVGVDAVDVNAADTYTITYNVTDAAGNAADEVTRTVIVEAVPGPSGDYLYATTVTVTIPSTFADWGTGTTIVSDYSGDATYNPSIQLLSGTGWGDVSAVAFTEMEAGILSNYSTLEFKIKTTDYTTIKVKVPEVEKTFSIDGTPLAEGWVQMSIPLSEFGGAVDAAVEFAIFEFGAGTMLITDVMLSGDGGGTPPPSDCPAPPAGELLSNGDFEAGDVGCWQFFAGTSISTTVSNGGSNSAEMQGATGAAVGLKQERFAAGILLPNTQYTVSFDIIADGPFGEGGVFKAFTFSESAEGSNLGAIQHVLADGVTSLSTSWETKTYTFTSSADANFVAGGLSFLIEIVNSSVKLNADNVVIKKTP